MRELFPIRMKRTPAEKEAIYALPLHVQFRIVYMHPESGFAVLWPSSPTWS